jgi:hypothetical protein
MAKRPALTEDSFLKHLFSPRKNLLPTGLRKRPVAFSKGRTKARVASYNRMNAKSQEVLRTAGLKDAYLRGDASLTDARKGLRSKAVEKGFAKPLRQAKQAVAKTSRGNIDTAVAAHIVHALKKANFIPNIGRIHNSVPFMPEEDKDKALRFTSAQIRAYAGDSTKLVTIDGEQRNPLWYN